MRKSVIALLVISLAGLVFVGQIGTALADQAKSEKAKTQGNESSADGRETAASAKEDPPPQSGDENDGQEARQAGQGTAASAQQDSGDPPANDGGQQRSVEAKGDVSAQQEHAEDPPGNNGHIKIEDTDIDDIPQNDPHPGCIFNVEFYNYDEGADLFADLEFAVHPPSGGPGDVIATDRLFIGEDPADGTEDATEDYDLREELEDAGAFYHPQQGWHIKLTIHADGSIGSDVKHKVFWVECAEAADVLGTRFTRDTAPETAGAAEVADEAEVAGIQLATTGAPLKAIAAMAAVLVWLGAMMLYASRRGNVLA